eukprot:CAMPEP_0177641142 /NCGR_PEP_ID=MMETSP0447-20121125/6913_1 /TAXON_ID=0 /ORGANISM="Stygamoeba regulata, Strain BSH-02190019" /LENGTH=129 /DNA_ID=CAMNT_0019143249 /DNA_START=29 /DNA_END=415 /DNA_ORIENTATION=-
MTPLHSCALVLLALAAMWACVAAVAAPDPALVVDDCFPKCYHAGKCGNQPSAQHLEVCVTRCCSICAMADDCENPPKEEVPMVPLNAFENDCMGQCGARSQEDSTGATDPMVQVYHAMCLLKCLRSGTP